MVAFVAVGAACGWLWHAWWAPAPVGVVVDGAVYFAPDDAFAATGTYVTVAVVAGFLLGGLFARLFEHDELVTLGAVLLGAVAAAAVMAVVGHQLGPESAASVAARTADFEEVRGDLSPGPLPAYAAFPGGALAATVVVLVTFGRRTRSASGQ